MAFNNNYQNYAQNYGTFNNNNYPASGFNQSQAGYIPGKFVQDFREITPRDVPMDATPAVFVKADMSEIQVCQWDKSGGIVPYTYVFANNAGNNYMQAQNTGNNNTAQTGTDYSEQLLASIKQLNDTIVLFNNNLRGASNEPKQESYDEPRQSNAANDARV